MPDPLSIFDSLREQYIRYYETPFSVRDRAVQRERSGLLREDKAIAREPWLEPIPPYANVPHGLAESCRLSGAHADLAEFAALGLIDPAHTLRLHQEQALHAACHDDKHVVVTAGTGSGKTEAFLLPLFSSLLAESASWDGGGGTASPSWWAANPPEWVPQRTGETGRSAAVRALVLYPMNALVDDQLQRLRRALDSDASRAWLDANRHGHRFYFGRYTSRTPLAGGRDKGRTERLASQLRTIDARAGAVRHDPDRRFFIAQLDGAEMRSRWDMQDHPPDILITNYSMLDVMLLRDTEHGIFEKTAAWLEESDRHRFTIIVDELHMYRGTAGTEIAFLLRNLLMRLGIADHPEKVRFLAASASVGGAPAEFDKFLRNFFAAPREAFEVLGGALDVPDKPGPSLPAAAAQLAGAGRALGAGDSDSAISALASITAHRDETADLAAMRAAAPDAGEPTGTEATAWAVCTETNADAAVLHACLEADGEVRAQPASGLAVSLFPDLRSDSADALRGLLWAMESSHPYRPGARTLRAHYFFRNVQGAWACSDPDCPHATPEPGERRTVGKLFLNPQLSCECGARVLELLYCQTCGELYLGGFRGHDPERGGSAWYLVGDQPELEQLPDLITGDKTAARYALYWPRPDREPATATWTRDKGAFEFRMEPCRYDPKLGHLRGSADGHTGWTLNVSAPEDRDPPALPTRCPNCGDDWEATWAGRPDDPGRAHSPIRYMRTGFEKVTQVLADALLREIADTPAHRKMVAFTDSRQDAAKLSAGLERRHYEDTVRQLLAQAARGGNPARDYLEAADRVLGGATDEEAISGYQKFLTLFPVEGALFPIVAAGAGSAEQREQVAVLRERLGRDEVPITQLRDAAEGRLLELGMNPAGPDRSNQERRKLNTTWTDLFDLVATPPAARSAGQLNEAQRAFLEELRHELFKESLLLIFAPRRRDFESIGLGWATCDPLARTKTDLDQQLVRETADGVIRLLGDEKRIPGRKDKGSDKPSKQVRAYFEAVAHHHRVSAEALSTSVVGLLEGAGAMRQYVLEPTRLYLSPAAGQQRICGECRQVHLHRAAGVCINCHTPLPDASAIDVSTDYYAHLATAAGGAFRLHTEELTAQTDWQDAQERQARFQGIFLDEQRELPLVDEIDLLSVTTTMEVGVDIGALRAVLMGNMPPMRFNYQQRVGRAGRRNDPLAAALTICRGRSHDEFYFLHPERITGEPPPVPYLDMRRIEIVRRNALAEILRRAFRARGTPEAAGDNIHGNFGTASGWQSARDDITAWVNKNSFQAEELCDCLLAGAEPELRARREELIAYVTGGFLSEVEKVASDSEQTAPDLSQRLAEAGLLPMFGFPTRTRTLYTRKPRRGFPWPPPNTVQRDAEIALSSWAPGSEVVKDKAIHRVVGIAEYRPAGPNMAKPVSGETALGAQRDIGQCGACGTIDTTPGDKSECPVCGAPPGSGSGEIAGYRRLHLVQPLGYRSDFYWRDYRDWFEWSASGSRPRMGAGDLKEAPIEGALVGSATAQIFQINDNRGHDWNFAPQTDGHGWVCLDALDGDFGYDTRAREELARPVALGSIKSTDVLVIGAHDDAAPPGITLSPDAPERRAAWYSLGFLLRGAAARLLEVQTGEIDVGLRAVTIDGRFTAQVFLSDSLENGAGYSTHLGQPAEFRALLGETARWTAELATHQASGKLCDSACYDCLKDYRNMHYHGLLDWRLAADLLGILRGEGLDPRARWAALAEEAVDRFCAGLKLDRDTVLGLPAARFGDEWILPLHPLENRHDAYLSEEVAEVFEEIRSGGGEVFPTDYFNLMRRPAWVYEKALAL